MFAQPSWPQTIYGTYRNKKGKDSKGLKNWVVNSCSSQKNQQGFRDSQGSFGNINPLPMAHVNSRWLWPKPWLQLIKWVVSTWATAAKVKAPDFSTCYKRGALRFERFFLEMDGRWCKKFIENKRRLKRRCWTCLWIYFNSSRHTEHTAKGNVSFCNSWNQIKTPRCRQCKSDT